jgi:uncharacterized protein (TIGR00255 family)
MIKSMTGYSTNRLETESYVSTAEVKSLNSKFLDLSIRIPKALSEKEPEVRNLASPLMVRGKVSISLEMQWKRDSETSLEYNRELFKNYFRELKQLAESVGAGDEDLFKTALQSPDVIQTTDNSEVLNDFWDQLKELIVEAIKGCDEFRKTEGASLQIQLNESLTVISECKSKIEKLDPERIERIRKKVRDQLDELIDKNKIDENRLEQELIYYIEKLDLAEELVRLESHLKYFAEVMGMEHSSGKKLGFISQEIGREINTIGSKANDADIQKLVVQMKDELEKIKEQILNVL